MDAWTLLLNPNFPPRRHFFDELSLLLQVSEIGCCSLDCFVYFVLSIALAFMAVSTTLPPPPDSNITKPNSPITHHHHPLSLNASKALRQSNFKAIATLLHISTLDRYQDLIITRRSVVNSSSQCLMMISGVEIVAPDMFSASNFVIHGISHTLDIPRA